MSNAGSQRSKLAAKPSTRKRRATTKSSSAAFAADDEDAMLSKEDAEALLHRVQGHLVLWPYDWLDTEDWHWPVDLFSPLDI